jgi:hypothetical protein
MFGSRVIGVGTLAKNQGAKLQPRLTGWSRSRAAAPPKRRAGARGMADAAKLVDLTLHEEAKNDEALMALADVAANQQAVAAE